MPPGKPTIEFEYKGIGQTLEQKFLHVPANQREYAWQDEHVEDLFRDLADAQASDAPEYFLGMIVLTRRPDGNLSVTDGQQRLATTTILLAAMRDYLEEIGEPHFAQQINSGFLQSSALGETETAPKLQLNLGDDAFFRKRILSPRNSKERDTQPGSASQERITRAAELAAEHVRFLVQAHSNDVKSQQLIKKAQFLRDRASVMLVIAPNEWGAFRMFETLNDRGLEAAQSDLVKNFLLSKAGDRGIQVHHKWASMIATLESGGEEYVVRFLRYHHVMNNGPAREHQLLDRIRDAVKTPTQALALAEDLANCAVDYTALRRPDDSKWQEYGATSRRHIATLQVVRVEQLRPILLAVAQRFSVAEGRKALRLLVSCSVRLLVGGSSKTGRLDRECAERAHDVGTGKIKTAKALAARMAEIIPSDVEFEAGFAIAVVGRADVARYVLRSLETRLKGESDPELLPNDNEDVINLEHVFPLKPEDGWEDLDPSLAKRLGNMALLKKVVNRKIGNESFDAKKEALKDSTFALTSEIGAVSTWDAKAIGVRQAKMAKLAVETWPITVS